MDDTQLLNSENVPPFYSNQTFVSSLSTPTPLGLKSKAEILATEFDEHHQLVENTESVECKQVLGDVVSYYQREVRGYCVFCKKEKSRYFCPTCDPGNHKKAWVCTDGQCKMKHRERVEDNVVVSCSLSEDLPA